MWGTMFKIDNIDNQILMNLQRYDAPRTPNEMASALGVSPATVRRRVKRLTDAGIVRIMALVDAEKVGFSVVTVIGLHVAARKLKIVTQILKNRIEITWLATSIGEFDVMMIARFTSIANLAEFVQNELPNINGITGTETYLCVEEIKTVRVTR